jgi:nicotinamide mononucleotide adenylyltransferase
MKMMKNKKIKIALFPCKANPPHIGHIITLLRIKDDYDKIIIDLLDVDLHIKPKKSITIFKQILDHFPNKFEYNIHKVSYTKTKIFDDIPNCDVIVTGNKKVYKNMKKNGLNVKLLERVPIYKGRYIREAYLRGLKIQKYKKLFSKSYKKLVFIKPKKTEKTTLLVK